LLPMANNAVVGKLLAGMRATCTRETLTIKHQVLIFVMFVNMVLMLVMAVNMVFVLVMALVLLVGVTIVLMLVLAVSMCRMLVRSNC